MASRFMTAAVPSYRALGMGRSPGGQPIADAA